MKDLYYNQFYNLNKLIGKTINKVYMHLDYGDINFTEQPNIYGKSLFNGIDIESDGFTLSIGNRFKDNNGLAIDEGETQNFEYIEDSKNRVEYNECLIKDQKVISAKIYWMEIPWIGQNELYPQEIELITENGILLISSIEINNMKANVEFTDELLLIEDDSILKTLKIGKYGIPNNGRYYFDNFDELLKLS